MKWIEKHIGLMIVMFGVIFLIEIGIGAWRMPREFRSRIIPKINRIIEMQKEIAIEQKEFLTFFYNHTHYYNREPKNILDTD